MENEIKLGELDFKFLTTITPVMDGDKVKQFHFRDNGVTYDENNTHAYWNLNFCQFNITAPDTSGVYAFFVNDELKYVGSAMNLNKRLKWYCKINQSAIKRNGQATDCHVNGEIYEAINSGKEVTVYICETESIQAKERKLRWLYKPEWNKQL